MVYVGLIGREVSFLPGHLFCHWISPLRKGLPLIQFLHPRDPVLTRVGDPPLGPGGGGIVLNATACDGCHNQLQVTLEQLDPPPPPTQCGDVVRSPSGAEVRVAFRTDFFLTLFLGPPDPPPPQGESYAQPDGWVPV